MSDNLRERVAKWVGNKWHGNEHDDRPCAECYKDTDELLALLPSDAGLRDAITTLRDELWRTGEQLIADKLYTILARPAEEACTTGLRLDGSWTWDDLASTLAKDYGIADLSELVRMIDEKCPGTIRDSLPAPDALREAIAILKAFTTVWKTIRQGVHNGALRYIDGAPAILYEMDGICNAATALSRPAPAKGDAFDPTAQAERWAEEHPGILKSTPVPDALICPFCGEGDFDKVGLRGHLMCLGCKAFDDTPSILEERLARAASAAIEEKGT
jgi:hypothetical protein